MLRHKLSQYVFVITHFKIIKHQYCYMASITACHYKKIADIFCVEKLFLEFFYRCISIHLDMIMNKS